MQHLNGLTGWLSRSKSVRVRLIVGALQLLPTDVGVPLGGGETGVAQQLLDAADIRPRPQKVGGERMSERVRANLAHQSASADISIQVPGHTPPGQPTAAMIQKQGASRVRPSWPPVFESSRRSLA